MSGDSTNTEKKTITIVEEGQAKVGFHGEVFYNPVQEFNRDLTQYVKQRIEEKESEEIIVEPEIKKKKVRTENESGLIRILDALSASGLRALRFSKEVPNVEYIMANDFSENAVESIKENIKLNGVDDIVHPHFGDAIMTMMSHRNIDKRFHAVDLDPYGSASVFLDSAVQCVADNGILMITCTDMAVLCGNTPEACYNKYGAISVRLKCCHEMALRILLRSVDSHANKYTRYIEPLVSISVDFYVRIFVRVRTGAAKSKDSGTKIGNVFVCSGCHSMETISALKKVATDKGQKYSTPVFKQTLMGNNNKCVHCNHSVHQAGPMYTGPIHNKLFVKAMLNSLNGTSEEKRLGTHNRLVGVLTSVYEELDVPLYYEINQFANIVKCSVPKSIHFKSAILNAGYQAKKDNVTAEKLDERAPGKTILQKEIKNEINIDLHPKAAVQTKTDQMVRFQCNKGKNWGPRQKAKGSVNSTQAGFQISSEAISNT